MAKRRFFAGLHRQRTDIWQRAVDRDGQGLRFAKRRKVGETHSLSGAWERQGWGGNPRLAQERQEDGNFFCDFFFACKGENG